jgi:cysteine-rich repeat protein
MKLLALFFALTPLAALAQEAPAARCGDAVVQPGEDCDDGNALNGDACPADCLKASGAATPLYAPPAPLPDLKAVPKKSPLLAFGLSAGGTLLSSALVTTTLTLLTAQGPGLTNEIDAAIGLAGILAVSGAGSNLGYLYTGEHGRAAMMFGLQLGSAAALSTGALLSLRDFDGFGPALLTFGLFSYTGSVLYSIADAPLSARRVSRWGATGLWLGPAPLPAPGGGASLGLAAGGRF